MALRVSLLSLIFILLLGGCQRTTTGARSLYDRIDALPGERLALSRPETPVFKQVELGRVRLVHENGDDIWLLAPDDVLAQQDASGEFRAWLQANSPVSFHVGDVPVYYIPGSQRDVLDMVLSHRLEAWADAKSLARLWAQQGDALMKSGRTQEAIDAYREALALDGSQMAANVGMGQAQLQGGDLDIAIGAFNTALLSDPWNVQALKGLGQAYFYQHRYDLAVDPLTRAFLLQPEDAKVLMPVALGLAAQGHQQEALKALDMVAAYVTDSATKSDINTIKERIISGQN